MQQGPQLVAHVDHHHLFARASQASNLALDGLGDAGVDGAAQPAVRGHADEQVLAGLVLRSFDVGLLVQRWREQGLVISGGLDQLDKPRRRGGAYPERRFRRSWQASAASQHERTWQQQPFSWTW